MFPDEGVAVQVNVAPATFEVRLILVKVDEQICLFNGMFERSGTGLTMTLNVEGGPEHPLAKGVIR